MSTNDSGNIHDLREITTYQAGIVQATAHRKLQKFSEDVLAPYDITKMHWLIIGTVLDHRGTGIRITDLARILGTNLSYMTNTVNLLESKKILSRMENSVDSRSRLITVHPKFLPNCKRIERTLRDALRNEIYSNINPDEFTTYIKVLYQLSQMQIEKSGD